MPVCRSSDEQKVDRQRQPRRREDFLLDVGQQLLHRHVVGQPLAERAEEVGLFDVFFAFEHGGESWGL